MNNKKWVIRVVRFLSIIIGVILVIAGVLSVIINHTLDIALLLSFVYGILLVLPYSKINKNWIAFGIFILYLIYAIIMILSIFGSRSYDIYAIALVIILLNLWAFIRINNCAGRWKIYKVKWIWIAIIAVFFSVFGIKKLTGTINIPWIKDVDGYEDNWMD